MNGAARTLAVLFVLGFMQPSRAQTSAHGAIEGSLRDEHRGAVGGATVSATAETSPWTSTTVADQAGFFRLTELPPGTYSVRVDAQGFRPFSCRDVVVKVGTRAFVDAMLTVADRTEAVRVDGRANVIDTTSTEQAANLSGASIAALPLGTARQWSDFLSITPGVTVRSAGSLSVTHAVRGSDAGSNVIHVDGANVASAALGSTTVVNIVPAAIEDVQVKTAAMDASSPLGVGAVMSIATKSGTDRVHGTLGVEAQRKSWSDRNVAGSTSALAAFLPDFTFGGPLWPGRLWFFGAYRYERSVQGISRTDDQLRLLRALVPNFEPFDRRTGGHIGLAKISGAVSRHRVEFSYQRMPRDSANATPTDGGLFLTNIFGGTVSAHAGLTSVWQPWLVTRMHASYTDNAQQTIVGDDAPARRIFSSTFGSGGRLMGSSLVATLDNAGVGLSGRQAFSATVMSVDTNVFMPDMLGRHELQFGVLVQRNREASTAHFANGGFAREEAVLRDPLNPAAGFIPFWREVWDVEAVSTGRGDSHDLALYVQHAWQLMPRVTSHVGVRADLIRRSDDLFGGTVQRGVNIGPRLGLVYALTDGGDHTLRASWGRIHDVLSGNRAAGTSGAGKSDYYDLNLDGTFETRFITPASTGGSRNRIFDPARGQPYVHDLAAGYRGQFSRGFGVDATFVRREYRHRTAAVETNGIYDGQQFRGYRDETQNDIYYVTANRWNWPVHQSLELHASMKRGGFQLIAGYSRSWRHLAGTWQPRDPAAFLQPSAFDNTRGIGGVRTPVPIDANSLSGSHMTADNTPWVDHALSLAATSRLPWGFGVSAVALSQSGFWSGPIVTRLATGDTTFGPPVVLLPSGRMVSNPLSTSIRFAHSTRGTGQLQAPGLDVLNIRGSRRITWGTRVSLDVALDLFNAFNGSAPAAFSPAANQQFSPEFRTYSSFQPPRSAAVSGRLTF